MNVKDFMNRPFEINRTLKVRTVQLQGIRNLLNGTSVVISDMPRSSSSDPHRLESLIAKSLDLDLEITKLTDELGKSISEVTSAINSINNPACEEVLTARYLCFEDWTTIARKLNYSKDWVYRLHRKGLDLIKV